MNKKETKSTAAASLVPAGGSRSAPPVLIGRDTPEVRRSLENFFDAIADIFERWVTRRESPHTQRAYRQDVMSFVGFLGVAWPAEARQLVTVSVADVQAWRDEMLAQAKAPKTLNRRVSSVSSFYKFLQAVAAEMRLPISIPNPAHAQFIARSSTDPINETHAMTATRARQLMGLPRGDDVIAFRDRAILRFYLYTGARIGTGCRLKVSDFKDDHENATIRLREKGNHRRTIGLHFAAAEAIGEYIRKAGLTSGPLFRPRSSPNSHSLSERAFSPTAMYLLLEKYLKRLPGAVKVGEDGRQRCLYIPHSLRATTATLLLDAGVDIMKVKELLGHRHVATTQIYDKRRRTVKESASHDVPI